jgi:amino acid permease-like protein
MYVALGITASLYILIAIGVFGTLTVQEVVDNGETALALAAKPALGQAGFAMMAIAALLATSSSVNANIYAASGSTAKLAESGMFAPVFGQLARVGGTRHLPGHLGRCLPAAQGDVIPGLDPRRRHRHPRAGDLFLSRVRDHRAATQP